MAVCCGLAPLTPQRMRVAILGSMPGAASLAAQQYYAHPRNAFWQLAEQLFGVPRELGYAERCAALTRSGVGLWDVLARCERRGSLDSAIDLESAVANDLGAWLAPHPLEALCFNGALAAKLFARHCAAAPGVAAKLAGVRVVRLPSSSPAHAAMSGAAKLAAWRAATAGQAARQPVRTR